MMLRVITVILALACLGLGIAAWWNRREAPPSPAPATQEASAPETGGMPATPDQGPALRWDAPAHWPLQADRPMRVATYAIPAARGADGGECAVFYFGPGQGGGVDANLDRWVGQFEDPAMVKRFKGTAHGIPVHRIEVRGTFLAPSGPRMESQGRRERWTLIGAIAEDPSGDVFFKLTGPAATVAAASPEFEAMLASLRKGQ